MQTFLSKTIALVPAANHKFLLVVLSKNEVWQFKGNLRLAANDKQESCHDKGFLAEKIP